MEEISHYEQQRGHVTTQQHKNKKQTDFVLTGANTKTAVDAVAKKLTQLTAEELQMVSQNERSAVFGVYTAFGVSESNSIRNPRPESLGFVFILQ